MSDWILLRGLAREARHWGPLPQQLEAGLKDARVLTPDHPGCGTEAKRVAPLTIAEMVEDLRERLLPEPGAAPADDRARAPFALLGLSLGGMVAMEWAARYPAEVARLVLVNTSAGDLSPPFRRLRPGALRVLLGAAASRDLRRRERAGFRITLNDPEMVTPELLEEWTRIQESAPVTRSTFLRQITASARYRAPKQLTGPVLILASQEDRMVDPRCSRALAARFRGATLSFHPSAGHDLPLEDPAWVVARIAEWMSAKKWA